MNTMSTGARQPDDRRWFRLLLQRILLEDAMTQYRLATRAQLSKSTVNKIMRGHRFPTEAQALQAGVGRVCTEEERLAMQRLLDSRWNGDTASALRVLMNESGATPEGLANATSIGQHRLGAFLQGKLQPTDGELLRLFVAAAVRDARLAVINALLEAARCHTIRRYEDSAPA